MVARPQTPEEYNREHLALLGKIIDKASAEPQWKQKLLSDPQAAFDEAGLLPEIDRLNPATWEEDEVTGQSLSNNFTFYPCCRVLTYIR